MQLLDAIIAFALTMAALATVVTVIMEAGLRIARMRKKNFIEVMKLLNQELGNGTLKMTPEERWDFFVRVVNNPAEAIAKELSPDENELPDKFKQECKTVEDRIAFFGKDTSAGVILPKRVINFCIQLFRDPKRKSIYEGVSLEYMLRCLAEIPRIEQASYNAKETLKVELNRIARKYEELGSSVSASFKHHAQYWSILVGIILAIAVNIHGLRIFEAYRLDPKLAAAVIEQQEKFIANHEAAEASLANFDQKYIDLKNEIETKEKEYETKKKKDPKDKTLVDKEAVIDDLKAKLDKLTAVKNIQETAQRAQQQMADLMSLGVPMGWKFYPGCPYGGSEKEWDLSSPLCKEIKETNRDRKICLGWFEGDLTNTLLNDPGGFLKWLFVVIVTGILIGLGAPFWFDIAKRLSAVRKGLQSASASSEYRLSAKNANGDPGERKAIVDSVIEQASKEVACESSLVPKGRNILSSDGTIYKKGG